MSNNLFCGVISSTRKFTSLEQLCRRLNVGPKGSLSQLRRWEVSLIGCTQLRAGGASSPEGLLWGKGPGRATWLQPSLLYRLVASPWLRPQSSGCGVADSYRIKQRCTTSICHWLQQEETQATQGSCLTSENTFTTSLPNTWPPWPACSRRDTHFGTPHLSNMLSTTSCHYWTSSPVVPGLTLWGRTGWKHSSDLPSSRQLLLHRHQAGLKRSLPKGGMGSFCSVKGTSSVLPRNCWFPSTATPGHRN